MSVEPGPDEVILPQAPVEAAVHAPVAGDVPRAPRGDRRAAGSLAALAPAR